LNSRTFSTAIRRLVGEGGEQLDLLRRERANLHAANEDGSDRNALAQHRRRQRGPMAVASRVPAAFGELLVLCGEVMDVNRPAVDDGPAGHPASVNRQPLGRVTARRQSPVGGDLSKQIAVQTENDRIVCLAQARGILADGVEHRLDRHTVQSCVVVPPSKQRCGFLQLLGCK
jgi:hypothetical protein